MRFFPYICSQFTRGTLKPLFFLLLVQIFQPYFFFTNMNGRVIYYYFMLATTIFRDALESLKVFLYSWEQLQQCRIYLEKYLLYFFFLNKYWIVFRAVSTYEFENLNAIQYFSRQLAYLFGKTLFDVFTTCLRICKFSVTDICNYFPRSWRRR